MRVVIDYFETGTKEVKQMTGKLFFGDALLSDYIGVQTGEDQWEYILIPQATVVRIKTDNLDEELYMVDTDSIKRSKKIALKNMKRDMDRGDNGGAFHG
jgi:hypothetical protein